MYKRKSCESSSIWLLLLLNSFVYISTALYSPFLSAYYRQNHLSSTQIGILLTIGPLASVFIQPLWARLSDKSGKARKYASFVVLGAAISLYSFYLGTSFISFLLANLFLAIFSTSVLPMTDAIVIRNANRLHFNYAFIRMGGTIGYAAMVYAAGFFLRRHPSAQFAVASFSYLFLLFLLRRLPDSEDHQPVFTKQSKDKGHLLNISGIFKNSNVFFVLVFAFIYQVGASFFHTFLGVYVIELGYGQSQLGILNCIQALSEIPILLIMKKFTRKLGALNLIALATFLMGFRLFAASGGSLIWLMLAQAMQGITYMVVHFGCATYIAENVYEGKASQGQSILYIIQAGLASIIGNTLGGRLIDFLGIKPSFLWAGSAILLLSGITWIILILYTQRKGQRFDCPSEQYTS